MRNRGKVRNNYDAGELGGKRRFVWGSNTGMLIECRLDVDVQPNGGCLGGRKVGGGRGASGM